MTTAELIARLNKSTADINMTWEYTQTEWDAVRVYAADYQSFQMEDITVRTFFGAIDGARYGIEATISEDPKKLDNGYRVVFAEDGWPASDLCEDLHDARRVMRRMEENEEPDDEDPTGVDFDF